MNLFIFLLPNGARLAKGPPTFLLVEMVLLSTTNKQKEKILPRRTASLGMVSIQPFTGLLGGGGWPRELLLSGQKEVGRGCCAEAGGLLATPGDLVSRPEEFPTEVERHGSAFDLERVLLHFSNVGSTKLKTVFPNTFPPSFLSHSVCTKAVHVLLIHLP